MTVGLAGWGALYNETDGQYGGAARVMAQGGSWLIPENNGIPRLVKPPLLYWGMAASMDVFGLNAFAARLPGALSWCALVALTFLFGLRLGGPWRGFCAGAVLLTFLGTFTLGRIVMPEPSFAVGIAAALYCVLRGAENESRRRWWFAGFWLCAALASFTKGMHGLLYPLVIVGVAAVFVAEARPRLRGLLSWWGVLLFLAINLPWYLYVEARFPGYLHNLVFSEQIGHITGSDSPATNYTDVPRWQFLVLHAAWFFPWSLVALVAWVAGRKGAVASASMPRFDGMVVAAWAVVILGSVLLAGERQDYYALTMWPAVALGLAWMLERGSLRAGAWALAGVMAVALAATCAMASLQGSTATVAERSTAWSTLTSFDRSVWLSLQSTAWFALGGGLACSLLALCWRDKRSFFPLVAAACFLDIGATRGTAIVAPYFSLAEMAPRLPGDARLVYDGDIDTGSSLLFYTGKPMALLDQNPGADFFVRKYGIGRDRYVSTAELVAMWKELPLTALVTESRRLPEWRQLLGEETLQPAAQTGTQILLLNRR